MNNIKAFDTYYQTFLQKSLVRWMGISPHLHKHWVLLFFKNVANLRGCCCWVCVSWFCPEFELYSYVYRGLVSGGQPETFLLLRTWYSCTTATESQVLRESTSCCLFLGPVKIPFCSQKQTTPARIAQDPRQLGWQISAFYLSCHPGEGQGHRRPSAHG